MTDTDTTVAAFHAAEAAHWRAEAETLTAALRDVEDTLKATRAARPLPPEPPIGTTYHHLDDPRVVVWSRRADGWHCGPTGGVCASCPTDWADVWNWSIGLPVPTKAQLGRSLPVEADIVDDLPPDPPTINMPRCPRCMSAVVSERQDVPVGRGVGTCTAPWHSTSVEEVQS